MKCGESASQTIFHAHIHIFPRSDGDKDNYVYSTTGEGYHNIFILKVDDTKVKKAYDAITKAYLKFLDVPGFIYDIRVCYKASEAIALMA